MLCRWLARRRRLAARPSRGVRADLIRQLADIEIARINRALDAALYPPTAAVVGPGDLYPPSRRCVLG